MICTRAYKSIPRSQKNSSLHCFLKIDTFLATFRYLVLSTARTLLTYITCNVILKLPVLCASAE